MSRAHDRLADLWAALEQRGATTMRVPLGSITSTTANRMARAEERRLRILAEEHSAGPARGDEEEVA